MGKPSATARKRCLRVGVLTSKSARCPPRATGTGRTAGSPRYGRFQSLVSCKYIHNKQANYLALRPVFDQREQNLGRREPRRFPTERRRATRGLKKISLAVQQQGRMHRAWALPRAGYYLCGLLLRMNRAGLCPVRAIRGTLARHSYVSGTVPVPVLLRPFASQPPAPRRCRVRKTSTATDERTRVCPG